MSDKELKEIAFIPFKITAKKLALILRDIQTIIENPKSPKTFITLFTDKGFSLNLEYSKYNKNAVMESIQKFQIFQKTRIGEEQKCEELSLQ